MPFDNKAECLSILSTQPQDTTTSASACIRSVWGLILLAIVSLDSYKLRTRLLHFEPVKHSDYLLDTRKNVRLVVYTLDDINIVILAICYKHSRLVRPDLRCRNTQHQHTDSVRFDVCRSV